MLPIGCRLQHPKSRSLALVGKYTGYSLRIGGACAVAASGGGLEVLRAIGGWSSDAVFTYMRAYVPAAMASQPKWVSEVPLVMHDQPDT